MVLQQHQQQARFQKVYTPDCTTGPGPQGPRGSDDNTAVNVLLDFLSMRSRVKGWDNPWLGYDQKTVLSNLATTAFAVKPKRALASYGLQQTTASSCKLSSYILSQTLVLLNGLLYAVLLISWHHAHAGLHCWHWAAKAREEGFDAARCLCRNLILHCLFGCLLHAVTHTSHGSHHSSHLWKCRSEQSPRMLKLQKCCNQRSLELASKEIRQYKYISTFYIFYHTMNCQSIICMSVKNVQIRAKLHVSAAATFFDI